MKQTLVQNIASIIIVFGHIFIFLYGFFVLGLLGPIFSEDVLQIVLMASPVLATSSVSAVKHIIDQKNNKEIGGDVTKVYSLFALGIPTILLIVIFLLFVFASKQLDSFTPNDLKISLGIVETFFGAYIGLLATSLFEVVQKPR